MISLTELATVLGCIVIYIVFRLRSQRAGTTTSKANLARLTRIKQASQIFQALIWISLMFGGYWFLAFLFGWPVPIHDKLRVVASQHHIYESPGEMPAAILALWIVKTCLAFLGMGVLLRLFQLYGRGILFSAKNVICIRLLGWWLIINWAIDYQLQGLAKDMDLSTTPVFIGLLIIFVA